MYGSYVKSLSKLLAFLGENWTVQTALQKLEDLLRDPVAVEEPSVVVFMIFLYAFDKLNKPDDFQVRRFACLHVIIFKADSFCSMWACTYSACFGVLHSEWWREKEV